MKYTGWSGYVHWSTEICELSHAPLATEYVCFFRVLRHDDAALKCISWRIVMKFSAMPISQLRYPWPVYLNHIPIRAYIITYLTGRIVTCLEITLLQRKSQFAIDSHSSIIWPTDLHTNTLVYGCGEA